MELVKAFSFTYFNIWTNWITENKPRGTLPSWVRESLNPGAFSSSWITFNTTAAFPEFFFAFFAHTKTNILLPPKQPNMNLFSQSDMAPTRGRRKLQNLDNKCLLIQNYCHCENISNRMAKEYPYSYVPLPLRLQNLQNVRSCKYFTWMKAKKVISLK